MIRQKSAGKGVVRADEFDSRDIEITDTNGNGNGSRAIVTAGTALLCAVRRAAARWSP